MMRALNWCFTISNIIQTYIKSLDPRVTPTLTDKSQCAKIFRLPMLCNSLFLQDAITTNQNFRCEESVPPGGGQMRQEETDALREDEKRNVYLR